MSIPPNPQPLSNVQLQFYLTSLDVTISGLIQLHTELRDKIDDVPDTPESIVTLDEYYAREVYLHDQEFAFEWDSAVLDEEKRKRERQGRWDEGLGDQRSH